MKPLLTLLLLSLPLLAAAQAQTVWRCGPDGRTYSDTPCTQGRAVEVPGARPAADVQAAQTVAEREQRLADDMRRDRLQREAAARHAGAAGIGPTQVAVKPAAKPAGSNKRKPKTKRPADDGTSRATAPASRQTKG